MAQAARSLPVKQVAHGVRRVAAIRRSVSLNACGADPLQKGYPTILKSALLTILSNYWGRSPIARSISQRHIQPKYSKGGIFHDHFAFRTFGVPGLGIPSIGDALTQFGYEQREYLHFPKKKLKATYFSPPADQNDLLPRIFVSELKVEELSPEAQDVIAHYTRALQHLSPVEAWTAVLTGALPWQQPTAHHYDQLLQESEYAAWVLVNGYSLNHSTVSIHRLQGLEGGAEALAQELVGTGIKLNDEGGLLKVSGDGNLIQFSTIADVVDFMFADGQTQKVAGAYLEFAERLPLAEYGSMPAHELRECHRRGGFETNSADKIFASTTLAVGTTQ